MIPAFNVIDVISIFASYKWSCFDFVGTNEKVYAIVIDVRVNTDKDIENQTEKVKSIQIMSYVVCYIVSRIFVALSSI